MSNECVGSIKNDTRSTGICSKIFPSRKPGNVKTSQPNRFTGCNSTSVQPGEILEETTVLIINCVIYIYIYNAVYIYIYIYIIYVYIYTLHMIYI